jgi:hypothetical protein
LPAIIAARAVEKSLVQRPLVYAHGPGLSITQLVFPQKNTSALGQWLKQNLRNTVVVTFDRSVL